MHTPSHLAAERTDPASHECDLLARVRAKEPAAQEALVRMYGRRMLQVARRYLRCEHDAAEVVQEAFAAAFCAIDTFAETSSLATWLHRITVNAALMKYRAGSRRVHVSLDALPGFDAAGSHLRPVPRWCRDACERASTREVQRHVRACIDRLPETYRAVLVLRDIEERDTAEVASLLDCSLANVKTRLHRARQALRHALEPLFLD